MQAQNFQIPFKTSGGLHGVGASVVNALSEWLDVFVKRNGHIYHQRYEKGIPQTPVEIVGDASETGTKTIFKPDSTIFHTLDFDSKIIENRLMELAFLNKNVTMSLWIQEKNRITEKFCILMVVSTNISIICHMVLK